MNCTELRKKRIGDALVNGHSRELHNAAQQIHVHLATTMSSMHWQGYTGINDHIKATQGRMTTARQLVSSLRLQVPHKAGLRASFMAC